MSIGKFVRNCVLENSEMKNEEILTKVKEAFPTAKTTYACIAWYKSDMRKKGLIEKRNTKTPEQLDQEIKLLEKRLEQLKAQVVTEEVTE
jgi:hypothetical protein